MFPKPFKPNRSDVEQVVFTVLSQNTTDRNAQRCLKNLKRETKGDLLRIATMEVQALKDAIKPCGMYNQKAEALKGILKNWKSVRERVKRLPTDEAIDFLKSFPYIGSKTARVILTFAFNRNTFPIDTHINRFFKRLGIFPDSWKKEDISRFMEENFGAEFNRNFHYNIIRFGRKVCRARKPECDSCPFRQMCSFRAYGGYPWGD